MSADPRRHELARLARKMRNRSASAAERSRYQALDAELWAEHVAARQERPQPRTVLDLPIGRWAWQGDARGLGHA